ncbi:MAG: sigma-70 family RNA polymerase sigma factor [Candidatus Latescibacteria bacterium]|nr:sigma-70 family RNA polymerase sigma factor [Candidatus Latescibacterota bacterium]
MDIEELYRRFGPMVVRRCRQLLRDEDDANDVAQDVFVQLIRNQGRLRDDYPSSLLYRIATNLCLNRIRDRQRMLEDRVEDDILSSIASSDVDERQLEARSILDRLFRGQLESTRTMAVLYYVDGLTLEEVAEEVGMSVSGVRKRLRGLRGSLKDLEEP